ncbi:hypothetical protein [Methylobacterium sp. Leaf100]|uniref:hypothetical protein n=1 Tax=Methylobacterium sp. Leaf100 TaxID=1736252 RepID=UPI000B0D1FED|nr:hypothetical protein [Methylobacterium sp. Leaf100]
MLRQLEIEALQADLESVRSRLASRTKQQDPVGFRQFTERLSEIQSKLAELTNNVTDRMRRKEIGLFFGGTPVVGSRGIDAEFASRAIESFQQIVSAKFASREGPVGQRGRIRGSQRAQMLIADVARGSFGFVLEQAAINPEDEGGVGSAIEEVVGYIHTSYSDTDDHFEEVARSFDKRLLTSMQGFFRILHSSGATLRVVSDDKQYLLQHPDIERAKFRVDRVSTFEETSAFQGKLLFTPSSKRFDLYLGYGSVISGTIAARMISEIMTERGMPRDGIADTWCIVELRVRETTVRGRHPTRSYELVRILSYGNPGPRDFPT